VEEEFFIVDPLTRNLAPDGLPDIGALVNGNSPSNGKYHGFDHEFQLATVETRTDICGNLRQVRAELRELRADLARAASDSGLSVVASGTLPPADWRTARIMRKPRYDQCLEHYREVVQRRLTCGCHVHVGIEDRELAVQVLNRVQPWLHVFLALSASSPFYEGADTGYQTYRGLLWGGFPAAGPPPFCGSYQEYADNIRLLLETGSILDTGNIYWDARLGTRYATLEFRIADSCTSLDEAVLQAGLARALVLTCIDEIRSGRTPLPCRPGLIRAAAWQAARWGLDGDLIDVTAEKRVAAPVMLDRLIEYTREALKELGDWDEVTELLERTMRRGTSARRQLGALARAGRLHDVVDELAAETIQQL
jgi:carboxylate-amine ligase